MASTSFTDKLTVINTDWLNDVNGTVWTLFGGATTASAGRTALGLGTMATQAASNVAITGGTITGLSSALPVASGGTGTTTSTGTGSVVLSTSPTITTPTFSGNIVGSSSAGLEFVTLQSTAASTEAAVRLNCTQSTSTMALKLSNSANNKQATLRLSATGGANLYVNQTSSGSSTSGTAAIVVDASGNITTAGTLGTTGALSENSKRVYSSNSRQVLTAQAYTTGTQSFTFAHSIGAIPSLWKVIARCTTADKNYAIGDIVEITNSSSGSAIVTVHPEASNFYVYIEGGIPMAQKGTGLYSNATTGRWNVEVWVWA